MELKVKVSDNIDAQTARQIENYFNGLTEAQKKQVSSNKDSFSYWLKNKAPQIYEKVSAYIDEIFNAVKSVAGNIFDAYVNVGAAIVGTPIIGICTGVKEGLENGLEAGIKKGFKSMGKFLDDVFE